MCGLVGYSGKGPYNVKWIEALLIWNSLERGEDATGIFTPKNSLKKSLTRGSEYVLYAQNQLVKDNYLIGHVRAGTVGNKTEVKNAHPFERGNYILAHNGTLYNHSDLCDKYNLVKTDYEVDSDMLTGCINEADDIATVIKQIGGAAALLIHDKRNPEVLNVFRKGGVNGIERPLFQGRDKDGNLYISSLAQPLYWIGLFGIKAFKEDTLYTIVEGEIKTVKKIKNEPYYKPVVHTYTYNRHSEHISTSNNNVGVNDMWKNLNIRCKSPLSINYMETKPSLNLEKDRYYLCNYTDPQKARNVIIVINNIEYSVSKGLFELDDIIRKDDLIKLNQDLVDTSTGEIEGKEGDIYLVDEVWAPDQDVRAINLKTNKVLGYRNKSNYVKLTKEEANVVYANNVQLALFNTNSSDSSNSSNSNSTVNTNNTEDIDDDTPEDNNQISVSYFELKSLFAEVNEKLEKLKEGITKGTDRMQLIEEVVTMEDTVFTAEALFLEPNIT